MPSTKLFQVVFDQMEALSSRFGSLKISGHPEPRFYPCHITGLDAQTDYLRVRWTTKAWRGLCYVEDLTPLEKMFVSVFVRGFHIGHPNGPIELWQKLLKADNEGLDVTTSVGLELVWKLFNRTSPDSTKTSEDGSVASVESVQSVTAEDAKLVTNFSNAMSYNEITVAIGQLEQSKASLDERKDSMIDEMLLELEKKKAALDGLKNGMLPLLDKTKIKNGSDFVTMLMDHLVKNRFPRKEFDKVAAIIVTLDEHLLESTWIQVKHLPTAPPETPMKAKKELTAAQKKKALVEKAIASPEFDRKLPAGEFLDLCKASIDSVLESLQLEHDLECYAAGTNDASAVATQITSLDCLMNEANNRSIVIAFKIGARIKEYKLITGKSFDQIEQNENDREEEGQERLFPKWNKDRMKRYSAQHSFILKYARFFFHRIHSSYSLVL